MNIISGASVEFKFNTLDNIFNAVKQDLDYFDDLGYIDETRLYRKIKSFLFKLGDGINIEKHAVIPVENYKSYLLKDFSLLFAAYRCSGSTESKTVVKHFQNGWSFWLEDECQVYNDNKDCLEEGCWDKKTNYRVRQYIGEQLLSKMRFTNLVLLSVTNRVWDLCDIDCLSMHAKNDDEISLDINSNTIISSFKDGYIYIQYWANLMDEDGYLLVLNVPIIEEAVEDFLKSKVLEYVYLNTSGQDIERKYLLLQEKSSISRKAAENYVALPSFQNMIQYAKRNRKKFDKFEMGKRRFFITEIPDNPNILSMTNHLAFYNLYGKSEIYPQR